MCAVGAMTQMPYTFGNHRRYAGSLATPFCNDTTGDLGWRGLDERGDDARGSCDFMPTSTTSSGPRSAAPGRSNDRQPARPSSSSGDWMRRPFARIASRCGPRAISTTSWPCWSAARRPRRRPRPRRRRRTASLRCQPLAEEREHAVERVAVGWPGSSTRSSVRPSARRFADAVRVARCGCRSRSSMRRSPSSSAQSVEARVGDHTVVREAHGQARRGPRARFDAGPDPPPRGRDRARASCRQRTAATAGCTPARASCRRPPSPSANPPLKHMPTAPTPGPPARVCRSRASARNHSMTGDVRFVAHVVNSCEMHTLVNDRSTYRTPSVPCPARREHRHRDREAGVDELAGERGDIRREPGKLVDHDDAGTGSAAVHGAA